MEHLITLLLQTEAPSIPLSTSSWVFYGICTILSLIGAGKIVEMVFAARFKKTDQLDDAKIMNGGKEIEAKTDALKIITERLKSVEARLDNMQDELRAHMETNARLSVENEFLKKENDRLTIEVSELRKDSLEKAGQVRLLTEHLKLAEVKIESMLLKLAGLPATPTPIN